jgi:hypothetical protein
MYKVTAVGLFMFHLCVIPLSVRSKFVLLRAVHTSACERDCSAATNIVSWLLRNDHLCTRCNTATPLEAKITYSAVGFTPLPRNRHVSYSKDSGAEFLEWNIGDSANLFVCVRDFVLSQLEIDRDVLEQCVLMSSLSYSPSFSLLIRLSMYTAVLFNCIMWLTD